MHNHTPPLPHTCLGNVQNAFGTKVKALRKEARARESKVVQEVLRSRDVVLATCVGAATYSLRDQEFDLVVIDEAAQVMDVMDRWTGSEGEGKGARRPA